MKRLLFLDQYSEPGGAQRCLLELIPAFCHAGYEVHVALPGDGPVVEAARRQGASCHRITCGAYNAGHKNFHDIARLGVEIPQQARRIAGLLSRYSIDLMYVNGPRLLPATATVAGGRPVIFHVHNRLAHAATIKLAGWSLQSSRASVVASSQFAVEPLRPYLAQDRTRVVYNGVAEVKIAHAEHQEGDPWRIGIVGRIAPEKGQLEFIEAARRVLRERADCKFVVCGASLFSSSEYEQHVRAAVEGLPIEWIDWQENVGEVFSKLDLLVIASGSMEATPRVIPEAFSARLPVLAFASGGIPELVENGRTGILVPPSAKNLAVSIIDIVRTGRNALDPVVQRARREWEERFSLDRYQRDVLEVVERLVCIHQ